MTCQWSVRNARRKLPSLCDLLDQMAGRRIFWRALRGRLGRTHAAAPMLGDLGEKWPGLALSCECCRRIVGLKGGNGCGLRFGDWNAGKPQVKKHTSISTHFFCPLRDSLSPRTPTAFVSARFVGSLDCSWRS